MFAWNGDQIAQLNWTFMSDKLCTQLYGYLFLIIYIYIYVYYIAQKRYWFMTNGTLHMIKHKNTFHHKTLKVSSCWFFRHLVGYPWHWTSLLYLYFFLPRDAVHCVFAKGSGNSFPSSQCELIYLVAELVFDIALYRILVCNLITWRQSFWAIQQQRSCFCCCGYSLRMSGSFMEFQFFLLLNRSQWQNKQLKVCQVRHPGAT